MAGEVMGLKTKYEFINMYHDGDSPSGKTQLWSVMSRKHPGMFLGRISWHGAWRQYVFFPAEGSIFSAGCMEDVAHFITMLHGMRREIAAKMIHEPVCGIPDCGCSGYAHP